MQYESIDLTTDPRSIATITLNRPDKHNAMNAAMMEELLHVAFALNKDSSVRGVVLTGAGESFCAGADLGWMRDNFARSREERIAESEILADMLQALDDLDKPLIGRVNGQSYAGGIGLLAVCDITIGVPNARFSVTEVRLGLTPANISRYLISRIGVRNARRTFLNAHFFKGEEAYRLGLLDKVVPADQLDAAVEAEIKELLACAPEAVAITKNLIKTVADDTEDTREYTTALLADCWEGEAAQSGITAFFDRKPAPWMDH